MTSSLLKITLIVLAIGILCGTLIVLLIQVWRRQQVVNSMVTTHSLIGLVGTVEVPFDRTSRGKVRLLIKGSIVEVGAVTDEARSFAPGDRVLIADMKGNYVWVVADTALEQ